MKTHLHLPKASLKPHWLKVALAAFMIGAGLGVSYGQVQIAPITNGFFIVPPNVTNGTINGAPAAWLENFAGVASQVGGFYITNDAPTNANGAFTGPWNLNPA